MTETLIRQERKTDFDAVFRVIEDAFKLEEFSDHQEQFLVERLRKSEAFIPELSLVAESDCEVVGYILLTKLKIKTEQEVYESLALAPVAVATEHQGKKIGELLIKQAHKIAKQLGYKSIILLGHSGYYPRFGYQQAHKFGIELPFDVPKENCMAIELISNGLNGVSGVVGYPKEFNE